MAEVAEAWVSLLPSAKGWGTKVDQQVGPDLDRAGRSGGSRFSGALGGILKKSVLGIGAAAGGILGAALFKGFARLSAIDQAEAKLKGLGNSTKTVSKIMDNALASVKGTAFGLGDAATVAAGAVASGIKPGKALTKNLKLVADAATIAGVPLNEMGAIFNKVAASGKIQGDVIAQLGDKGIPILQLLGKQIHATPAEVSKLASQGKIDFATFSAAMQSGLGGAALKSGNTFKGALANMQAALGRLGAGLLKDLFPIAKKVFGNVTVLLDNVTSHIDPAQKAVKAFFTTGAGHAPAVVAIGAISDAAGKIGDGFKASTTKLDEFETKLGTLDLNNLDGKKIGSALSTAASTAVAGIGDLGVKVTAGFGKMLRSIDWVGIGIKAGPAAIGLTLGLATGILNGITDPHLWHDIWDHGFDIAIAVLAVAFAPGKVADAVGSVLARIPFAGRFLAFVVSSLNEAGAKVKTVVGDVIGNFFTKLFEGSSVAGVTTRFVGFFKGIPAAISTFFVSLGETMYLQALSATDRLAAGIRTSIPSALTFVASIPGKILRALGSLLRLLSPRGAEAVSGLLSGLRSRIGSVTSYAASIPGKIKGSIKGAGTLLKSVGGAIVDGLVKGISGAWHKVTDYISSKVAGLGKIAKKILGINSPSKVFAGIGSGIGEGMALGISQSADMPVKSVHDMASSLTSSVRVPAAARYKGGTAGTANGASAAAIADLSDGSIQRLGDYIIAASHRVATGVADTNKYKDTVKTRMPGAFQEATA